MPFLPWQCLGCSLSRPEQSGSHVGHVASKHFRFPSTALNTSKHCPSIEHFFHPWTFSITSTACTVSQWNHRSLKSKHFLPTFPVFTLCWKNFDENHFTGNSCKHASPLNLRGSMQHSGLSKELHLENSSRLCSISVSHCVPWFTSCGQSKDL